MGNSRRTATVDTIFALSSGSLPAAVAIVRISGPQADEALTRLIRGPLPSDRRASLRTIYDDGPIDRAVVLRFPGPNSFTGEDVVELQVTGSRAVVARLQDVLSEMAGLRPATPGEFARRALAAGKMDLTEAEGLAALIDAETEAQRTQAMMAADGGVRDQAEAWRDRLLRLRADAEAELDFGDAEGDIGRGHKSRGGESDCGAGRGIAGSTGAVADIGAGRAGVRW